MAKTTGRPLVFATGQFLRHGATGTTLDLSQWQALSSWQQRDTLGACLLVGGTLAGIVLGTLGMLDDIAIGVAGKVADAL